MLEWLDQLLPRSHASQCLWVSSECDCVCALCAFHACSDDGRLMSSMAAGARHPIDEHIVEVWALAECIRCCLGVRVCGCDSWGKESKGAPHAASLAAHVCSHGWSEHIGVD